MRARSALLHRETELAQLSQDVSRGMREMPMLKLSKDYIFTRPDGRNVCLPNLFAGKRQLVVYHLKASGECFPADAARLETDNTAVCAVSTGLMEDVMACGKRAGVQIPCYVSVGMEFGRDMRAMMTGLEGKATHDNRQTLVKGKGPGPMGKGAMLSKNIMDDLMDDLLDGKGAPEEDGDVGGRNQETGAGVSIFCKGADGAVYHRYSCSGDMAEAVGLVEVALGMET
ncbi:hypothetical protein MAPG_10284 [Magnaporthiopsis poae ATCC 64411]|uniref:Uncharacterized protein n=1 Tax=Magnaporthiopsis poae (strain ATCC 64411 / 73-15) TaxID=644358 RepID=A0A0C4EC70_MAGP6|nr:hypothetical protein MAPG_10284 [Magnaporthiopsis poae ATCC 64411]